jgi:hypothetical protein
MEILNSLLSWLPWLFGGGTLATIAIILIVWKTGGDLSSIAASILKPIAAFSGENLASFGGVLKHGFADIVDDGKTTITVLFTMIALYAFLYYSGNVNSATVSCKPAIEKAVSDLRKDYRFVKRK